MRNQDDPQYRQTLASLRRPPETAFGIYTPAQPEPVLVGSQKGRGGSLLKDREDF